MTISQPVDALAPPHDPEAEMTALGAMLAKPEALRIGLAELRATDFFRPEHADLFRLMGEIARDLEADERLDIVTVANALRAAGLCERIGGQAYLVTLIDTCPAPSNIRCYAKILRDTAALRWAMNAGAEVVRAASRPGADVSAILTACQRIGPETARRALAQNQDPGTSTPVLTCMADVTPVSVKWLWPGRIPLGRITLLVGRPGEGKSILTRDLAARISTGTPWPGGGACPTGSVLLISAEDAPDDVIRPQLDAAHADARKVHLLAAVRGFSGKNRKPFEVMFTLKDLDALEAALKTLPDCKLIVIDPIGSFIGGTTDAHRDNEVRSVLAPVAMMAAKYGPAVLVIAHRRKSTGTTYADDLALGSRAFTGIARAIWHLSRDPNDKTRRLLLPGKNNLAPEGDGFAFSIIGDPPALAWERDPVRISADDGLAAENGVDEKPGPAPDTRNRAAEWLRDLLAAGPMQVTDIQAEAEAAGYAPGRWRTVHRAKDELGIKPYKAGFSGAWTWRLPSQDATCQDPPKQEELGILASSEKSQ
jgi:hypothetical protein